VRVAWHRLSNLTLWVLQGALALLFLYSGLEKFSHHGNFWPELFARIGLGQWLRYFTGGLEVVCAFLLLIPKTLLIASTMLVCAMSGAILVHLFILRDGYACFFPGFTLAILLAIAWGRLTGPRSGLSN
jgi:putative oxidoreductase